MMKRLFIIVILLSSILVGAQNKLSLDPTITPALFQPTTEITVTYDVTGTSMAGLSRAWAWVWIGGKNINSKYNVNPAPTTGNRSPAEFEKIVENGKSLFRLTFKPSDFFNQSIAAERQLGILLKGSNWSGCGISVCQTTDYLATFWDGSFQVKLTGPNARPLFVSTREEILISAEASVNVDFKLFIDDVLIAEQKDTKNFLYSHVVTQASGYGEVRLTGVSGANSKEIKFLYLISSESPKLSRPCGIIPGINYHTDPTKVTLCLWAPQKSSVYVRGDFSDWDILPEYLMNRHGEYFWIELDDLSAGQEYAFQYLVNESLWIADPFADKILDPDDQYIPAATYPDLKTYPKKALLNNWYFNRLSVFQTNQPPYQWQSGNYRRPAKEKLVVYELLIRDFFGANERNFQNLIDTLTYLKTLGVNAIELMPIMEFNGNESWGYNPAFMFAVDKYYGAKNKFKEFVDTCHGRGIAVILDIAVNHQDIPNPMVLMDFDFSAGRPTGDNKWFFPVRRHPFNVFFDMNHGSTYTQHYVDSINHYWINEYKIDGFRFDLSKGFSTTNYCTTSNCDTGQEVNAWSSYDSERISILKRMADRIWEHSPDAYIILEHFAANSEEKELAEYRADEDKGMLFWGNLNHAYLQNAMGYSQGSNIDWIYHGTRGWSVPHVIGYMESHDEERMMFKNLRYGNTHLNPSYSVKELYTALERVKAASVLFYTIPGPKMLWQFGELGYDISINQGGRTSPKPVKWEYRSDYARYRVYEHMSDLIRLRHEYDIFTEGTATLSGGTSLVKQLTLKSNPYTATPVGANQMNAQVVVNFDVKQNVVNVNFPHAGIWYDYYRYGEPVIVKASPYSLTLKAGEYKLFTDVEIMYPIVTSVEETISTRVSVYPNPVTDKLFVESEMAIHELRILSLNGKIHHPKRLSTNTWDVSLLSQGFYVVLIDEPGRTTRKKIAKL